MKITFSDYSQSVSGEHYDLSIEKNDNDVLVSIESLDYSQNQLNIICYRLSKEQLKDFIGALLHIQSKLKGNGRG